ncbi:MAG: anthranilate phosphoribosyltransferase, partial [Planctomycetota bacterium]
MMIREAIETMLAGKDLAEAEAADVMEEIMDGRAGTALMAAYLIALRAKGETVPELVGSARVMRAKSRRASLEGLDAVDMCGTGGDGKGTFNVSTTAAFVVAGGGVPVAKHGNRAASSRSGSADVLEALGACIELEPEKAARSVREVGIGFFFAPAYHP